MIIQCQLCGREIEIGDVVRGQHILCPFCDGKFSYEGESDVDEIVCPECGISLEMPKIQERRKVECPACHQKFITAPQEFETRLKETKSENPTVRISAQRKKQGVFLKVLLAGALGVVIIGGLVVWSAILRFNDIAGATSENPQATTSKQTSRNPKSKWYRGPHGTGMTNAEYHDQIMRVLKHAQEQLSEQETFKKKAEASGYYIFDPVYKDGRLQHLYIARGSLRGEMHLGLAEENMIFPSWLPECEAMTIWKALETDWGQAVKNWTEAQNDKLWDDEGNSIPKH